MLKIGSCTVLYNPDKEVLQNIHSYMYLVDVCVVVDNSDTKNKISRELQENLDIVYLDMHENLGIAYALNRGIEYLHEQGMDFALTMDQDSVFPTKYYADIENLVETYQSKYSLIGLNFNQENGTSNEIIEVPYWLTSGNFVKIHDFMCVGKFNEDLFIDYVDFELGYKFYQNHLKMGYLNGYSIRHTIGNPIPIHIFNKTFYAMNHAPIRYYYRYRNSYYLYKKVDSRFFKKEFFKEMVINTLKMVLVEKNRKGKLKMILKGIDDAKNNRLGKYTRG